MHNDVNDLENNTNCDESIRSGEMFLGQEEEESLLTKDHAQAKNIDSSGSKTYLRQIEDLTSDFNRTLNKLEVIFKLLQILNFIIL